MRKQCDGLARELQEQAQQVTLLHDELLTHGGNACVLERLRAKLQDVERHSEEEQTCFYRALSKHKKEVRTAQRASRATRRDSPPSAARQVILLNSELSRAKKEEERVRRHNRQLEAELKVVQRRVAAVRGGRPDGSAGSARDRPRLPSRPGSNAVSRPSSNASSRPSSRTSSAERTHPPTARAGTAGGSRSSSRASSVASSTAASRAGSVERTRASRTADAPNTRALLQASSAGESRVSSSRAGSARGSAPSSRASSAERSRPPFREHRPALPSLERVAREALLQTSRQQRRGLAERAGGGGGTVASKGHRPTSAKCGLAIGASLPQQGRRQSGSGARDTAKAATCAPACHSAEGSEPEDQITPHISGAALTARLLVRRHPPACARACIRAILLAPLGYPSM